MGKPARNVSRMKQQRGSSKELAIRAAAAGLGAVCGGPLGAAIGGWIGAAIGLPFAGWIEHYADKFMEKAGEVLLEEKAESVFGGQGRQPDLQEAYREALRRSLNEIRGQIASDYSSWFDHWDFCLKRDDGLDLADVNAAQLVPEELDRLFRSTMERLDAQGASMQQKTTSLALQTRPIPDSLLKEVIQRLPSYLQKNFLRTLSEPEYEAAWKVADLLGHQATQDGIRELSNRLLRLEEALRIDREERRLVPEDKTTAEHKPWALEHFVAGTSASKCPEDTRLSAGQWVVASFELEPSGGWKDPFAKLEGLWNEQDNMVLPFSTRPLKGNLRSHREVPLEPTGLCIPSYKVEVEWREESLVKGPLWGGVKRKVVSEFLQHCGGKRMICRILHIGRDKNRRDEEVWVCRLFSADYDSFLIDRWSYYKNLEGALSTNDLYKAGLSKADLDAVLSRKLIQKEILETSMAERFNKELAGRKIEEEDVRLVLQGLIERYEIFKMNEKLRRRKRSSGRHH